MNTATITITKEQGEYTGRVVERIYVRVGDGPEVEAPYGANWGFDANGKRYRFQSNLRGPISIVSPDGGKALKLGAKGGTIDLDTWTKI